MWSPAPLHPNSPHYPSTSFPSGPLFPATLISPEVSSALPPGYTIRPLQRSDYKDGILDVLRVLTTVSDVQQKEWDERYDWMAKRGDEYFIIVVCDGEKKIVGTGAIVVDQLADVVISGSIHNLGLVGHIEDIVVAKDQQGKKLGLRIIEALDFVAQKVGCYKTILNCSETNEGFYVKCGFKRSGLEMAQYYEKK
ncbi:MAG: hypothetical protein Q9182_005631 [Xanthomendoza sp. 2 TL-2023]